MCVRVCVWERESVCFYMYECVWVYFSFKPSSNIPSRYENVTYQAHISYVDDHYITLFYWENRLEQADTAHSGGTVENTDSKGVTSVLNMIQNHLMGWLQSRRFGECGVALHCYYNEVHPYSE